MLARGLLCTHAVHGKSSDLCPCGVTCFLCSQTKEHLTLRSSSFGSKCELPQPFIDKVAKCGVVDSILQVGYRYQRKQHIALSLCPAFSPAVSLIQQSSCPCRLTFFLGLSAFPQFATFKNSRELKKSDGAKKTRVTGAGTYIQRRQLHLAVRSIAMGWSAWICVAVLCLRVHTHPRAL